ncbi:MAG: 50S ribosomal protein L17 [Bacteroidales bacterium]|jgi:large subunit ribosomal protein L17|nr:50S ribosomal protein L17 [Bacteroidales bacterium]MEE1021491.1 50S ribosomal protein L17 [Bacteroidales bacterium]
MRHGCKVNKLSRTHAHRAAMLSNMASSLILHKRIETTLAKAKALRGYVEPLINRTKADSTHQRRMVFSYLQNKEAVKELFGDVATKVANRPGGYTRILKLGRRMGDGAEMVMMELVDYNEAMLKETTAKKAKTTRRGGKKKATETVEAPAQETVAQETVAEETKAE